MSNSSKKAGTPTFDDAIGKGEEAASITSALDIAPAMWYSDA